MHGGPSLLSLTALGIYALVAISAIIACTTASTKKQQRWHTTIWVAISVFFSLLVVWRLFDLEHLLREEMRDWLRSRGAIGERRVWQGYAIAVAISAIAAFVMLGFYSISRKVKGRRNIAVLTAAGFSAALLGLIGLRMISLHSLDQLLFGPLKLNWVGDIGCTLIVLGAAGFYTIRVRGGPKDAPHRRPR